jgi:hypothetical protein
LTRGAGVSLLAWRAPLSTQPAAVRTAAGALTRNFKAKAMAARKTSAEIIGELVREKIAASV